MLIERRESRKQLKAIKEYLLTIKTGQKIKRGDRVRVFKTKCEPKSIFSWQMTNRNT